MTRVSRGRKNLHVAKPTWRHCGLGVVQPDARYGEISRLFGRRFAPADLLAKIFVNHIELTRHYE
jgi:hypothetical protein